MKYEFAEYLLVEHRRFELQIKKGYRFNETSSLSIASQEK